MGSDPSMHPVAGWSRNLWPVLRADLNGPCEALPPYSRTLARQNEETRAAIESDRLAAQLMAWREAMRAEQRDPGPAPRPGEHDAGVGPTVANRGTPRIGEVSPVALQTGPRPTRLVERIRLWTGRVIDVFG